MTVITDLHANFIHWDTTFMQISFIIQRIVIFFHVPCTIRKPNITIADGQTTDDAKPPTG